MKTPTTYPQNSEVSDVPDFKRIFESLQKEVCNMYDLSNSVYEIANGIKNIDNRPHAHEVKEKEPSCLVDYLWDEIFKMQQYNRCFSVAIDHLQKTIG